MNTKFLTGRRAVVAVGLVLALGGGVAAQATATGSAGAGGEAGRAVAHSSGGGGGSAAEGGGKGAVPTCSQEVLGVSATKEPADSVDARHFLLIVQNAGEKKCNLYRHPLVRLGDGQRHTPVIEESDATPGVPVTLAPGQEAYAGLVVNGPMDEYEARSITLTLQGRKTGTTVGRPIDVPVPVERFYANDFQRVTYWTTAPGLALDFVLSR